MAVTYGFFNSVNGDRKYNAEQMSEYFRGIINEGVYQHLDGGLAVTAGTGLAVSVASGRAIIQNRWMQNSAALSLTIAAASETYARKDAVVIRLNWSSRSISIAVKTGTPAASPVAPSMTRNSTTYEMALAYVNVAANATSVTVTDKRSDSTVCGWVTVAQSTSGEVDAQLNAMKTGFDRVVYPSPAEAVQGQFNDVRFSLNMFTFENKSLATDTKYSYKWVTNAKRLTTATPISFPVDVTITPKSGYVMIVYIENKGLLGMYPGLNTGSVTSSAVTIKKGEPVYLSFGKSDSSNFSVLPPDVVTVETADNSVLSNLQSANGSSSAFHETDNNIVKLSDLSDFDTFSIYDTGMIVDNATSATTIKPVSFPVDVTITPRSAFKMIVFDYNDGVTTLHDGYSGYNQNSCQISKGNQVFISVRYNTAQNNMVIADVFYAVDILKSDNKPLTLKDYHFNSGAEDSIYIDSSKYWNKAYTLATSSWVDRSDIISNKTPFYSGSGLSILTNVGMRILLWETDADSSFMRLVTSSWVTGKIDIQKDTYFFIQIAKINSGTAINISPSEIYRSIFVVESDDEAETDLEPNNDNSVLFANDVASGFFITRTDTSGLVKKVINPYEKIYNNQYMGQLHDHTWTMEHIDDWHTKAAAETVYNDYLMRGFDFMTATNYPYHDDLTPCPVADDSNLLWFCNSYEQAITPETIDITHQNTHLIVLNAKNVYNPSQTTVISTPLNDVIDELDADGCIITLAHPMWYSGPGTAQTLYTKDQLLALNEKLKYVEVFNTLSVDNTGESPYVANSAYALDVLASDGRIVWGTAVSDSHVLSGDDSKYQGNIKVFAPTKSRSDIWASYLTGNFYSCEKIAGKLNGIIFRNGVLTIDIGDNNASTRFYGKDAEVLKTQTGAIAEYQIQGDEMYVRAEITTSSNGRIWTNPIYLTSNLIGS